MCVFYRWNAAVQQIRDFCRHPENRLFITCQIVLLFCLSVYNQNVSNAGVWFAETIIYLIKLPPCKESPGNVIAAESPNILAVFTRQTPKRLCVRAVAIVFNELMWKIGDGLASVKSWQHTVTILHRRSRVQAPLEHWGYSLLFQSLILNVLIHSLGFFFLFSPSSKMLHGNHH